MSGGLLPSDRRVAITAPTLVLHGDGAEPRLIAAAHALAAALRRLVQGR